MPEKQWIHQVLTAPTPPKTHRLTKAEAALLNTVISLQRILAIQVGASDGDIDEQYRHVEHCLTELKQIWGLD